MHASGLEGGDDPVSQECRVCNASVTTNSSHDDFLSFAARCCCGIKLTLCAANFLYNTILSIIGTRRRPKIVFKSKGTESDAGFGSNSDSEEAHQKMPNNESLNENPVYRLGHMYNHCRH